MGLVGFYCKNMLMLLMFPDRVIGSFLYVVCPKSKCTDFLFKYLLDLSAITSYLLQSMTFGNLHSGSNVSFSDHSTTGNYFP